MHVAARVVYGVVGCIVGVIVGWLVGRLVVWAWLVTLDNAQRFYALFPILPFLMFASCSLGGSGGQEGWAGREYMRQEYPG